MGVSVKNEFFTNELVRFANIVPQAQIRRLRKEHGYYYGLRKGT